MILNIPWVPFNDIKYIMPPPLPPPSPPFNDIKYIMGAVTNYRSSST